jgi:hypothetical protein
MVHPLCEKAGQSLKRVCPLLVYFARVYFSAHPAKWQGKLTSFSRLAALGTCRKQMYMTDEILLPISLLASGR